VAATVTSAFFDEMDRLNKLMRQQAGLPAMDALCTSHRSHGVEKCTTCAGTGREPIPTAEVMQYG
jgi:hypothetical protein